ncbi:MAG: hypothetical protein WC455_21680 [Dehalococcoidia bacterium]
MTQQTLEGKTDCRRETKGTIRIKITPAAKEKFPEICEGIREVNRKYPCVKISVNGKNIGGSP